MKTVRIKQACSLKYIHHVRKTREQIMISSASLVTPIKHKANNCQKTKTTTIPFNIVLNVFVYSKIFLDIIKSLIFVFEDVVALEKDEKKEKK